MLAIFQISNGNLLFGFLPESATVLVFGVVMFALTLGIRRFLKPEKQNNGKEMTEGSVKK